MTTGVRVCISRSEARVFMVSLAGSDSLHGIAVVALPPVSAPRRQCHRPRALVRCGQDYDYPHHGV